MSDYLKSQIPTLLIIFLVGAMVLYGIHIMASCVAEENQINSAIERQAERAVEKVMRRRG